MTNNSIKIAVFCGSKLSTEASYADDMKVLAGQLKENSYELVFGASNMGLMQVLCETSHELGVRITGVITQNLFDRNIAYPFCDELIVVENVHLRKLKMGEISHAVVCFPGGIGTADEFFSILSSNLLKETRLPIILLNLKGCYDFLIQFLKNMSDLQFVKQEQIDSIVICDSVTQAFASLKKSFFKL